MNQKSLGPQVGSRKLQLRVYSVEFTASARRGQETTRASVHSRMRSCITHWVRQRWSTKDWKGVGVHVTRPRNAGEDSWTSKVHLVLAVPGGDNDKLLEQLSQWGPQLDDAFSQKEQTFRDNDGNSIVASISAAKGVKVLTRIPSELTQELREVAQQFANENGQRVTCPDIHDVEPAVMAEEVSTKTVTFQQPGTGTKA